VRGNKKGEIQKRRNELPSNSKSFQEVMPWIFTLFEWEGERFTKVLLTFLRGEE
jgi:hypothetical protein